MFYEYELSMKNKQYFFPLAYFFLKGILIEFQFRPLFIFVFFGYNR